MTNVVYKYEMGNALTDLELPFGAKPLHAAVQNGALVIWMQVDPRHVTTQIRRFQIFPTGLDDIPESAVYIATVFDGPYVFHVYEIDIKG